MKRLYLDEFHPVIELVTPQHTKELPRFPVIDMHAHFGPLLLGENYEETILPEQLAAELASGLGDVKEGDKKV